MTSSPLQLQNMYPMPAKADATVAALRERAKQVCANDMLYQDIAAVPHFLDKEISAYLKRDTQTLQRSEKKDALPPHEKQSYLRGGTRIDPLRSASSG